MMIHGGFASSSGVLFGIPSEHRQAVKTIIKITLKLVKKSVDDEQ